MIYTTEDLKVLERMQYEITNDTKILASAYSQANIHQGEKHIFDTNDGFHMNINSFDNKTFDNKKISQIHNSLDKNNCILSDAKKLNQKVAYIRDRNKYKQPNRQSFVVREKMIQVKNICFELMAELDLTITDVMRVFITAHSCGGLTNNKKAIQDLNYNVKDENKIKKMKEFSRLFQYYANQNDILSPNSSNKTKKQVGLRTKRVLDLFNGDVYALIEFLKENTTNIQLSK